MEPGIQVVARPRPEDVALVQALIREETLARAGLAVQVIEGAPTPGGGCRTQELTLPGFRHDVCSAVHPLAAASPFFQRIDLAALGATLRTPKVAFAVCEVSGFPRAMFSTLLHTFLSRQARPYLCLCSAG